MSVRVQLIGCSGSGKTTLGAALARRLGVPFVDLDELFWEPGWVEVGHAELARRLRPTIERDAWVIAGNYSATTEHHVWPRLTHLVILDLPFAQLMWRTVMRSVRRAITGEPCCNGNRETWRHALTRDAPIRYTLRVWPHRHARYPTLAALPALAHARVAHLKSAREVQRWQIEGLPALTR